MSGPDAWRAGRGSCRPSAPRARPPARDRGRASSPGSSRCGVSVHLTGRFNFIAQKHVMKSAGYVAILLPNPPPTSGAITRSLSSGTPVTTEHRKRRMCGFCVVFHSVSSPDAPLHCASAARGSIAFGMSRCWTMRSLTTTSAFANAASMSPPATVQWKASLFGDAGMQLRRPGFGCRLGVGHRRKRLVVDLDELERVGGLVGCFGDDHRDDVAHVADDVAAHALVRRRH